MTKYHIPNPSSPRHQKKLAKRAEKQKSKPTESDAGSATTPAVPKQQKAYLELKTFDPESGACLKYKTDKAAEVGRLIGSLGRLGRGMAALPEKLVEDGMCRHLSDWNMKQKIGKTSTLTRIAITDVEMKEAEETAVPQAEPGAPIGEAAAVQQKAQQSGGGGGKKKKKGKR